MNNKTLRYHKNREIFVSSTNQNVNESPSALKRKRNHYYAFSFLSEFMKHCRCAVCLKFETIRIKGFSSSQTFLYPFFIIQVLIIEINFCVGNHSC
jgi:hypothetical protein